MKNMGEAKGFAEGNNIWPLTDGKQNCLLVLTLFHMCSGLIV